ncbi:MAG: U32 family peptidase [Deltaproteobacteria bacterium]|nr:U32 family peptidase [Deltaproteobacteria bacterium]
MEKFRTALLYGADAVYLGGPSGNLRAAGGGFDAPALREAVAAANRRGAKIYYCLNALPFERDMAAVPRMLETAADAGVHALIVADPGILRLALRHAPGVPLHVSTQANTTNASAVRFWTDAGASRVVLARELPHREIRAVREQLPETELEVFVHGAMCLAVSGQCLLSAWLNNRPANLGRCTQPCRFEYRIAATDFPPSFTVEEALRKDRTLWSVRQDEAFAALFAPDDLCLLPFLPWFVKNRINAVKIEGRTKGSSYVAHVTDAYRAALDAAKASAVSGTPFPYRTFLPDLARTASRPLSTGFFLARRRGIFSEAPARPLLAKVLEPVNEAENAWAVTVMGKWDEACPAELMLPGMRRPVMAPGTYALENHRGERTGLAASGTRAVLHTETPGIVPGVFVRGTEGTAGSSGR